MNKLTAIFDITSEHKVSYVEKEKFQEAFKRLDPGRYIQRIEKVYGKITARQHRTNYGIPYFIISDALTDCWGRKVDANEVDSICKENCFPESARIRQKEAHDMLCKELYSKGVKLVPEFRLTKTDLTTVEQNEYYTNMQNWAMDFLGIDIPDPNPKLAKDYKEE